MSAKTISLIVAALLIIQALSIGMYIQVTKQIKDKLPGHEGQQMKEEQPATTKAPAASDGADTQGSAVTSNTRTGTVSHIATSDWKTYRNQEIGFSFSYPPDAHLERTSGGDGIFKGRPQWSFGIAENSENLPPLQYWEQTAEPFMKNALMLRVEGDTRTRPPEIQGISYPVGGILSYRVTPMGAGQRTFIAGFMTPGNEKVITYTLKLKPKNSELQKLAEFLNMISTFRFSYESTHSRGG